MTRTYHVELSLAVDDPSALWSAAADVAMAAGRMSMDDVIDTIGSSDDPQICDCIQMIIDPSRFAGCSVQAIGCAEPAMRTTSSSLASPPEQPRALIAIWGYRRQQAAQLKAGCQPQP